MPATEPILVAGAWRQATTGRTYRAIDPSTGQDRGAAWPVSRWGDVESALEAATGAARELGKRRNTWVEELGIYDYSS